MRIRQRGQALVEMSLLLPVLMLLIFGAIDFGLYLESQASVAAAATTGARYAVTHPAAWSSNDPAPPGTMEQAIQAAAGTGNVPNDSAHISITYTDEAATPVVDCGHYDVGLGFVADPGYTRATCVIPGSEITVTVTSNYRPITPVLGGLFASTTLTETASMTEEQ